MRRSRSVVLVVLASALVLAAGCGPGSDPSDLSTAPSPEPSPRATPPQPVAEPTEGAPAPQDSLARAAWVHLFDDSLKTRAGIRRVVADLVAAGATAVIAEVVRRQDAYYDSEVLPRTTDPALEPGLDVLDALIEEAHAAGLEVHAWIPFAPTWHEFYTDLPAPDGWVSTAHGPTAAEADRWVTRTVDGTWDTYLDPGLPEVRAHVAAIVGEIAAEYPVDGIHLDYVRYPSKALISRPTANRAPSIAPKLCPTTPVAGAGSSTSACSHPVRAQASTRSRVATSGWSCTEGLVPLPFPASRGTTTTYPLRARNAGMRNQRR